jgi:hypothetical protein
MNKKRRTKQPDFTIHYIGEICKAGRLRKDTNKEIAVILGITLETVRKGLKAIDFYNPNITTELSKLPLTEAIQIYNDYSDNIGNNPSIYDTINELRVR